MWFYTKLDADEKLEPSHYDRDAPISPLSLLRQRHGDQPVLILRRDGKTVELLSESILPTSVCEACMNTRTEADPIVLIRAPTVRARRRASAEGVLATLEDLYKDVVLSSLCQERSTTLQLLPLSELPSRVTDMWGPGLLEGMYISKGLAPFALPPGTPRMESILAWASIRGLDRALKSSCSKPLHSKIYSIYHREMLRRFGVSFGKEGSFSMLKVKRFPPLVVPSHLGVLRIEVDYAGGVDCGLLPYGGSDRAIRIGFVHLPLPQADEGDGAESNKEADFEECKARAMHTLVMAVRQQYQPFYLDMTDGTRHHILYHTHNTHVMVHTDCTPVEAYYLLSGLLKGEITYGGAAPDPGHFRCPANQGATPTDNTKAPVIADSSLMSGTINADPAEAYVEEAVLNSAKPSPGIGTSHATDSDNDRSSMGEEESRASLAQGKVLEESLDLEAAHKERNGALQCDGEESESGCSEAAVSDGGSDSCWSTCLDAEWQVI